MIGNVTPTIVCYHCKVCEDVAVEYEVDNCVECQEELDEVSA